MRVRCTLPNAAEIISGVRFHKASGDRVSEDMDAKTAARFLRIPGYAVEPDPDPAPAPVAPAPRKPRAPAPVDPLPVL